jgi:hypothetical protein
MDDLEEEMEPVRTLRGKAKVLEEDMVPNDTYLPPIMQHKLMGMLMVTLEHTCYRFVRQNDKELLRAKKWDSPESVALGDIFPILLQAKVHTDAMDKGLDWQELFWRVSHIQKCYK